MTRVKSDRPRLEYAYAVSNSFCPGARFLRQPKPQIIPCPSCGEEVEIWSDEVRGFCRKCGRTVLKNAAASCLDWCEHARECVGAEAYETYMRNRAVSLRQRLMRELVERLGRPDGLESPSFRVVHDADALARLGSEAGTRSREDLKRRIDCGLITAAGRAIGRRTLLT